MDGTTIWAIAAVVLVGLVISLPLYWSRRRTRRIADPTTRANAERAEEEVWRFQRQQPLPPSLF
jgi:hypothetical protein